MQPLRRMQPQGRSPRLPLKPLARAMARAMAAAGFLVSPLWLQAAPPANNALPTGLQVTAGQASLLTQGNQMTVRNSNGAILNWSSFNIGAAAGVYFDQASAASKVLNRVTGQDPTQILGSLASNGQVWLLNPNGVLFGQGARVDVASLVTSTLRLNDSDFLNNRYRFTGDAGSTASVRNEGTIRSANGGQVVLLGAKVENTGSIEAHGGNVTLAAARSVELVDTGLPNLAVRVDVPEGEALNLGRLVADGGTVDVFGAIVNQNGFVQADTLAVDAQGRVTLKASDTLMLGTGSLTQARGTAAGSSGGNVDLLGTHVGLAGTATVDVSGTAAGGGIRVGGGLQGQDSAVPNAQAVWFGPNAQLRADATGDNGAGGRIVLWSDAATRAYGSLSARGGRVSGAGGFVETSGGWLDARPANVDVSSRSGQAGSWLLDPNDILITSTGSDTNISGGPSFTSTNDSSVITTATIAAALNAGTSVTVSTGTGGSNSQAGDILMSGATLAVTPTQGVTLTLQAARDIVVNGGSSISSSGQALNLNFIAAGSGQGAIEVINSSITTAGGNVTLGGANSVPLQLPDGTFTQAIGAATGYVVGSSPASATSSGGLVGVNVENAVLNLGAGTFKAAGTSPTIAQPGTRIGSALNTTAIINAADIQLFGLNPTAGSGATEAGLLVLGQGTALNATQGMTLTGAGRSGVEISQGARLALLAASGSGASANITGYSGIGNAVEFQADDFRHGLAGTGTRVTVSNAALNVTADSTANAALVAVNDNGAPGPLFDLAAATSATFRVNRSAVNADWGAYGLGIANVELILPRSGATLFTADLGVALGQNVMTLGGSSASLSFSGQAVALYNSLLVGSGSTVDFITTGSTPQGVALLNTTLISGSGDIRFGALQNVNSSVLGNTSTPARWVEYAGSSATAALSLNGSTLDAGTASITGGGANRGSTAGHGTEIVQSNLNARQINLAGRSDAATGLLVDGSTLYAERVLKLDGLSAGTSANTGAGLRVAPASTLQVSDAAGTTGSQMALSGTNISGYVGVALEGGDAGSGNETRLIVSGAALDIRGDGPVAGGAGVLATGTAAAPGGLLINALGATGVLIDGSTSSGAGGGLKLQYANVLGAQATASANMTLRASGRQVNGAPALWVDNSTVTTGGTLTLEGDGMIVTSSGLTGENGLFLHSNAASATGPIQIDQSILSTSAANAQIRVESSSGGAAVGDSGFLSGTGVSLNSSGLQATGSGSSIVINGRGAASGGTGVSFVKSPLQADSISITGTGVVDGHGIWSENFGGGLVSTLSAINLTLNGQSANNATTPDKAGVLLSNGAAIVLHGRGAVSINGDTAVLGGTAAGQPFTASGDAASFSIHTTDSLQLRNATLDFSAGSGTAINLDADSDRSNGGRVRVQNALLKSGGAGITLYGEGVRRGGSGVPQNSLVLDGAVGTFLISSTLDAGSGTATITGRGPSDGTAQAGNFGNSGVQVQGANSVVAGTIRIAGDGGDYGRGVDVGLNSPGASLALQANDIGITGRGTGIDPTSSLPYAGVQVNSSVVSNWTVLNPGTGLNTAPLTVTSTAGAVELSTLNVNTGRLTATSASVMFLGSSSITAADSISLTASGASINGSVLGTQNTSLTAGGALQLSGTSSDAGVGLMLLDGSALSGSTVSLSGSSASGPGVWMDSTAGTPTVQATSGALSVTGVAVGVSGVRITGGWQLRSGTTLLVDSNEALVLEPDSGGTLPSFRPGTDTTFRFAPSAPLNLDATTAARFTSALQNLPATGLLTWDVGGSSSFSSNAVLSVPGRMVFQIDNVALQSGAQMQAGGSGDALVFRGHGSTAMASFSNTAGANALVTPSGRWVLLATQPSAVALGGLQPAFTAYDLNAQPWTTDAQGNYITPAAGNALGYGISTAALNGQALSGLLSKTYDASTGITLNPATWSLTGLASGDTLSFTGSNVGTLAGKNVGTGLAVNASATSFTVLDAAGHPVFGYGTPSFTANVTPLAVALTGTTVASKVYDGNATGSFSNLGTVTPLAGDSLGVGGSATATFSNKNVGTGKTVAVGGFALTGADAGNYTLLAPATLSADITPLNLAVTGLAAQSKVYDTTTTATLAGTAAINPVAGDAVVLGGTPGASFANKNVGTGKAVTVTGYGISGADAANYTLVQPTGLTANITPAAVSLNGLSAQSKVYDTSTTTGFLGTASVTPLAGDVLTLAGTAAGQFNNKNAGTGKPVTLSGLTLAGADAANYTLAVPAYTASIAPASLGLLNVAAAGKAYDGNRTANMSGTLTGVLAGDSVNLGLTGQFSDANVGTAKTVTWTASTTGADAGNYILAPAIGAVQASITPATLTYAASPVVGTAGQSLPVLTGQVSGFIGSDTLAGATTGTLSWTTTATAASAVGSYAVTGGGLSALNYVFTQAAGNATALTLQSATTADPATTTTTVVVTAALVSVQLPVTMSSPTQGRVLDVTTAFVPVGSASDSAAFRASAGSSSEAGGSTAAASVGSASVGGASPAGGTATGGSLVTASGTAAGTAGGLGSAPGAATAPAGTGAVTSTSAGTSVGTNAGTSTATNAGTGTTAASAAVSTPGSASGSTSAGTASASAAALPLTVEQGIAAALRSATEAADGIAFRALDLSRLPRDEVQSLLAARARYKQKVFAKGVYRLQQDPTLADVRACRSESELDSGACIVTEQLKQEIQAARQRLAQASAPRAERVRRGVKVAALPVIQRKLALVIGINKYKDANIPELTGSVPDARAVQQILDTRMGYETTVLEDAGREQIVRAFNKLALEAEANDSVIVYYAGHGVLVPVDGVETGYWLPSDVNAEAPASWLSNADIARMVAAVGAKQVMLVSDSCYSGQLVGRDRVQLSDARDASELLKRRAAVVMSSGGDEPVADTGREGHSVFAWHFMRALEGLDQWQVGGSLYERIRAGVVKDFPQTPQYGASRGAGHQGNTDYLFERRELESIKP